MSRKDFIKELKEKTKEERKPFVAHVNLLDFCNLHCTHCCVNKTGKRMLKLEDIDYIVEELKKRGIFLVTLSGGECTYHPQFKEIYMKFKEAGMYLSIFTNGTNFTSEIKELFHNYPPRKVEVSVYGRDEESFYETCGSRKGYAAFLDALEFLKNEGIRTVVKTPLTKKNYQFLDEYIALADRYNAEYKFGTFLFPALDGSKEPLKERLDVKTAVEVEFSDSKALEGFALRANSKGTVAKDFNDKCSACTNAYTINSDKSFLFCGMMESAKFPFNDAKSCSEAFDKVTEFRKKVIALYDNGPCKGCGLANVCAGCPAHLFLESGNFDQCDEYFKDIATQKIKYLNDHGLLERRECWGFCCDE